MRARIDGEVYELDDVPPLDKQLRHRIDLVVDRVAIREGIRQRLADSLETALKKSGGLATALLVPGNEELTFSQNYACPECGINIEELSPRMFSFNNPYGACPSCGGLGTLMKISEDLVVPDPSLSLNQGAVNAMGWNTRDAASGAGMILEGLARHMGFSMDTPFQELTSEQKGAILYGLGEEKISVKYNGSSGTREYKVAFEGVIPSMERRYEETQSDTMKAAYEEYMCAQQCPVCRGKRLKKESLAVTVGGKNIIEITECNILATQQFLQTLQLG